MATDPSSIFDRCYEMAISAGHPAESHTGHPAESHTEHPAGHPAERGVAPKTGGVLAGLRVLETATVLAGPAVGMFLAECGARVLKLEPPTGDVTRQWTLPEENPSQGRSAYFCSVNWGKASLQSHLNDPDEQAVFRLLLAEADLLISNNLPHQEKSLGLDWETLHALNPRLIAARINGYGPSSSRPGYDSLIQAESGYVSMNGPMGGPGHKMPVALMDVLAAHQLKEALLLALLQRGQDGLGREVRVSLLDAGLASLSNQATNWWMGGVEARPMGSEHPNIVPYGSTFRCHDGLCLTLAVGNNAQFEQACKALQIQPEPAWASPSGRLLDKVNLLGRLQDGFARQGRAHWLEVLEAHRVPAAPVNDLSQALASPAALRLQLRDGPLYGLRTAVFEGVNGPNPPQNMAPPPVFPQHSLADMARTLFS